ncbi:hypothetical protein WI666_18900 [Vibrio cholerae]
MKRQNGVTHSTQAIPISAATNPGRDQAGIATSTFTKSRRSNKGARRYAGDAAQNCDTHARQCSGQTNAAENPIEAAHIPNNDRRRVRKESAPALLRRRAGRKAVTPAITIDLRLIRQHLLSSQSRNAPIRFEQLRRHEVGPPDHADDVTRAPSAAD